jgi:hypothetical protein
MPQLPPLQPKDQLSRWGATCIGDWTAEENRRIRDVFLRLAVLTGGEENLNAVFNEQTTSIHHSGRPGTAGFTRGDAVYLNNAWSDWTLAHELGHRWNNAWGRKPQQALQRVLRAGHGEWLKAPLRRFQKRLEGFLKKRLRFEGRLDWRALWYDPGNAPPPCGVDRNFNASEDLAECFAAALFPEDARSRAHRAAKKPVKHAKDWDWGRESPEFGQTERGKQTLHLLLKHQRSDCTD